MFKTDKANRCNIIEIIVRPKMSMDIKNVYIYSEIGEAHESKTHQRCDHENLTSQFKERNIETNTFSYLSTPS